MRLAFDYMQRDGDAAASESELAARRDRRLGLSAALDPPGRAAAARDDRELQQDIVDGAYWLRKPGPNCAGRRRLYRRGRARGDRGGRPDGRGPPRRRPARGHVGRPAQCRLDRGAARARTRTRHARSHIERLLADVPRDCGIVTVIDGHPATLSWLGAVHGHRYARSASSISARPARCRISTAITASMRMRSLRPRRALPRDGRSAICGRCRKFLLSPSACKGEGRGGGRARSFKGPPPDCLRPSTSPLQGEVGENLTAGTATSPSPPE